jgi:RNA polymerase sigma-70 factor, ECF subfamily
VRENDLNMFARAAARGDQQAFAELVAHTQTEIWRFCAYLVDRQSADDLTQDTYLRAFRALPRFRSEAPISTWLLTIARRTCIAEIDRRVRARELRLQPPASLLPKHHDMTGKVDIDLLIAALEPHRRAAFILTQVIGCDYGEAAAICQCPIGTIRSRVARARHDLIAHMAPPIRSQSGQRLR